MAKRPQTDLVTPLLAGLLAWLIPGAGHVYLRRTLRGAILCVVINALFWSGVAIGGVFTMDPSRESWWYAAQMCTGASGVASWFRQNQQQKQELMNCAAEHGLTGSFSVTQREYLEQLAKDRVSLTHPTDIVARAYTGIAGMLNLLCVFDAIMLAMLGRLGEPPPQPAGQEGSE